MRMLEHQAKGLLALSGIAVPDGRCVTDAAAAATAAAELGFPVIVKAQVPTGGRGKAGGVVLAQSAVEAEEAAARVLRLCIGGFPVHAVLVEKAWAGQAAGQEQPDQPEWYASVVLDRRARTLVALFSTHGGMEIESALRRDPRLLQRQLVAADGRWWPYQARALAMGAGLPLTWADPLGRLFQSLICLARSHQALVTEINPLWPAPNGTLWALDAKIEIDDAVASGSMASAAPPRAPEGPPTPGQVAPVPAATRVDWAAAADSVRLLPAGQRAAYLESVARELGLAYVRLDGEVGVIGNGAGLVMATLDSVQRAGARPACFLDVGGGARRERVADAIRLVAADPQVRLILVNVLGGITRGDEVAAGILDAWRGPDRGPAGRPPLIVRLAGNQAEAGRALLASHAPATQTMRVAGTLAEAINLVVDGVGQK